MNLKKTVLSVMAAGSILMGGMGAANAQYANGNTTGTVTVTDTGLFNAQFCGAVEFTDVNVNSSNPSGSSTGMIQICYTDTEAYRGSFRTTMSAGTFYGPNDSFSATNLKPGWIYNVAQGQWGIYNGNDIGDIGGMKGDASYNIVQPGGAVRSDATEGLWVGGDLSQPRFVGYGWAGVGTGGNQYGTGNAQMDNGAVADIGLILNVPSGLAGGDYQTTFTLTVAAGTP